MKRATAVCGQSSESAKLARAWTALAKGDAVPLEMISCGKCKRCLAGGRVHGPYAYHYEWSGNRRRHLYGHGGSSAGDGSFDSAETDRIREEAEAEAAALEERLTDEQRRQRERVMALLAKLRRMAWHQKRETLKRKARAGKPQKGLADSAVEELGRQLSEQFALEREELGKQIRLEKAELERMLRFS